MLLPVGLWGSKYRIEHCMTCLLNNRMIFYKQEDGEVTDETKCFTMSDRRQG